MQKFSLVTIFVLAILFAGVSVVQAIGTFGDWNNKLQQVAPATGIADHSIPELLGTLIKVAMGILATVFFTMMVYAGWKWFTALGQDEQVKKAIGTLTGACIGLIIAVSSFALSDFVITNLTKGAQTGGSLANEQINDPAVCCLDLVQRCTEQSVLTDVAIPRWAWRITTKSDCVKRGEDDKDPNDCKFGPGTYEVIETAATPEACEALWEAK